MSGVSWVHPTFDDKDGPLQGSAPRKGGEREGKRGKSRCFVFFPPFPAVSTIRYNPEVAAKCAPSVPINWTAVEEPLIRANRHVLPCVLRVESRHTWGRWGRSTCRGPAEMKDAK